MSGKLNDTNPLLHQGANFLLVRALGTFGYKFNCRTRKFPPGMPISTPSERKAVAGMEVKINFYVNRYAVFFSLFFFVFNIASFKAE